MAQSIDFTVLVGNEDITGDILLPSAINDLTSQLPDRPVFINNSYKIPEDIFGRINDVRIPKRQGMTYKEAKYLAASYRRSKRTCYPVFDTTIGAWTVKGDNIGTCAVEISCEVDPSNPRAEKLYHLLQSDHRKFGFSVGGMVLDYEQLYRPKTDAEGNPIFDEDGEAAREEAGRQIIHFEPTYLTVGEAWLDWKPQSVL